MHLLAVINKDAGSIKRLDVDNFCLHIKKQFQLHDHVVDIKLVTGDNLVKVLEDAAQNPNLDGLIACGGDGTASLAAKLAYEHSKILALLPAGTMNLFARTLGIPLELYEAVNIIAQCSVTNCDLASVNGKTYIHQFSVGMQPSLIEKREEGNYDSKVGKMASSIGATLSVLSDDDTYKIKMNIDGVRTPHEVSLFAISNNPYGENHLPYADRLNAHNLGVYWAGPLSTIEKTTLVVDILAGNWSSSPHLNHTTCSSIEIKFDNLPSDNIASLDGELIDLDDELFFKSLPSALKILAPISQN